jgi:hypothetical protein
MTGIPAWAQALIMLGTSLGNPLAPVFAGDPAAASLIGAWHVPESDSRGDGIYVFRKDGTVLWCCAMGNYFSSTSGYTIDAAADPMHIDLHGFSSPLYEKDYAETGIFRIDAAGQLELELRESPHARPIAFSAKSAKGKRCSIEELSAILGSRPAIDAVQPDMKAWSTLTLGMGEKEVAALLGDPRSRDGDILTYGHILYPYICMGWDGDFRFLVAFREGKVSEVIDPFNKAYSFDGKPTIPMPMTPLAGVAIPASSPVHFDLRWSPSSGDYPMAYDWEVQNLSVVRSAWETVIAQTTDVPFATLSFTQGGGITGRYRVRGKNGKGMSGWSGWRTFTQAVGP